MLLHRLSTTLNFPDVEEALRAPNGLLAIGGDLSLSRMLLAYHQGIFPWFAEDEPPFWWAPDPRAVLHPRRFHLSRNMKRFHQRSPYRVTLNHDFASVIQGCAGDREEGTWITAEVIDAWLALYDAGHAHSVEVWQQDRLVGGLYGMALGQLFCAESMFSRCENASKTALKVFCDYFQQQNGQLIDCQILNPHTASLGAEEIARDEYKQLLSALRFQTVTADTWQKKDLF
ncbi:MAG: Leucyl/phenylalanyl-tRNA--protein transferase [Candidatus Erwinia impunctatus]|nr:Leucyl/phenylalanyl-tRNA--protein transferase [Culicoides impunctatus]